MPKSLTKPPVDDPQAIFKYGLTCGIDLERERIIALLDTLKCGCDDDCDIVEIPLHNLLALIKGETE